jgi:hypothetical protein
MVRILFVLIVVTLFSCKERTAEMVGKEGSEIGVADDGFAGELVTGREDSLVFNAIMKQLSDRADAGFNTGRIIRIAGEAFLQTPYVASTLEVEGDERLVVNMRGVDCTTLVEYVAAIALTFSEGGAGFGSFAAKLADLRYRDGRIDGYTSRLHYFSDWLKDNERNGYLQVISDSIGDKVFDTDVGFMTANPGSYRQLGENPEYLEEMALLENAISWYNMRYISKEVIDQKADLIEDGDIVAFVSGIGGLDVSHTGLAVRLNGRIHLLHASARTMEVEITEVPLSEYIMNNRNVPGILVARVIAKQDNR